MTLIFCIMFLCIHFLTALADYAIVHFTEVVSVCKESPNDLSSGCEVKLSKINCETVEDTLTCKAQKKFNITNYEQPMEISAMQQAKLSCEESKIVNITHVAYQLPKNFYIRMENCSQDPGGKTCASLTKAKCTSSDDLCHGTGSGMDSCNHTYPEDQLSILRSLCIDKTSCTIELPRLKMDNYDKCVMDRAASIMACGEKFSYCHANQARVDYSCSVPAKAYVDEGGWVVIVMVVIILLLVFFALIVYYKKVSEKTTVQPEITF